MTDSDDGLSFSTKRKGGLPDGSDSKVSCLQGGRPGFDPWVRKISWRKKWRPTPVFLPGKSHGWRSLVGLQSTGLQKVRHDWVTCHHLSKGNELSCHEKILEELKYILLSERSWPEYPTLPDSNHTASWKTQNYSDHTLATWCKEPAHLKRPWCWDKLRAWREEGDRGWDDWTASLPQQPRTSANSRRW